ncbi:hypothetical protein [Pantoea vagans]|uniref:hypothetical protein n=1 Tax=Pantoea vagans TaxID=470934 RepID=UPI00076B7984|nr:hypothetical protein [Pantoea vagans]AMG57772.1 hypothetical protein AL522_09050 [Pantoea vagans]
MSHEFRDAVKLPGIEASLDEKHLYNVQLAVKATIDFVVTSFEQLGIDKFHELVDPSLGEIEDIIMRLDVEAKRIGAINLQQILLGAQIMINDIKAKNPELCEQGAKFLKNAQIFGSSQDH